MVGFLKLYQSTLALNIFYLNNMFKATIDALSSYEF